MCSLPLCDIGERSRSIWLPLARAPSAVKTRLADDCALRVECRLVIDPAPLLDRALKRLSDALATRAPDAAPATPQTPPRSAPPSVKTATDARGRVHTFYRVACAETRPAVSSTSHKNRSGLKE